MKHYDLVVIGTGPAGQKGAIQAAKLGKRVAVVEKDKVLGGAEVNTGTIPSKALREAALHLTGHGKQHLFGVDHRPRREVTIRDVIAVSARVIQRERDVIHAQFARNGIDLIWGEAHFEGPNLVQVVRGDEADMVTADKFLIAVGTRPARPKHVPFDNKAVYCSDAILAMGKLPRSIIVVGGGVIGTEYACIFATLGVRVTLIEGRHQVLGFLDQEITEAFQYFMRRAGITLRLGEKVAKIEKLDSPTNGAQVTAVLESGKHLQAETLLYAVGRQGVCKPLQLENVGLEYDDRERLKVNEHYQTAVEHIYAAGDVIGFPALASTSFEQGRRAVCHAFGQPIGGFNTVFPFGIYSVPEISMVGLTEEQLTEKGVPYEAGVAEYAEIARGQIVGDEQGMLKLLIHQDTHEILGVHCIGTGATELVHIGQAVMSFGGKADYFINNVFNFPTMAEAYRIAAYNGLNKLAHVTSGGGQARRDAA